MSEILRVGIAGVGTVGAAVARLLQRQADALTSRTGRKIVVTGVSARDQSKKRDADFSGGEVFRRTPSSSPPPATSTFSSS